MGKILQIAYDKEAHIANELNKINAVQERIK
jgi:hypothetical protein